MIRNWITRKLTARYRNLFRFWDGRRYVSVDPMVVYRRLGENLEFDPIHDIKRLESPRPNTVLKSYGGIADAVRKAFDLPVYDGVYGLTEIELVDLYKAFEWQMNKLKKNLLHTQGSPQHTDLTPAPDHSDAEPNTNNMSGSGLTSAPA